MHKINTKSTNELIIEIEISSDLVGGNNNDYENNLEIFISK